MSDVKLVHIHLQLEVPEVTDLADLTKYLHTAVKQYHPEVHAIRIGVKPVHTQDEKE